MAASCEKKVSKELMRKIPKSHLNYILVKKFHAVI